MAYLYDGKDLDKLSKEEVKDIYLNQMSPTEQQRFEQYDPNETPLFFDYENATKSTFNSTEPYEYLSNIDSEFTRTTEYNKMKEKADEVGYGIRNFEAAYKSYMQEIEGPQPQTSQDHEVEMIQSTTDFNFNGEAIHLKTSWRANSNGVYRYDERHELIVACSHPIFISNVLVDKDNAQESVVLQFKRRKSWNSVTVPKSTIASPNSIVRLADFGVAVTSNTAKGLIDYLAELEALNENEIKTELATSSLGWTKEGEFLPYTQEIKYNGQIELSDLYKSIGTKGDFNTWKKLVKDPANKAPEIRIALGGAVASITLQKLNIQPFFVHIHSPHAGSGKTTTLMLAASLYGNPELGQYVQSFNSTVVAMEYSAALLNSFPLFLDELQLSNKYRGQTTFNVYYLAQGQGKSRGRKDGGIREVTSWQNTTITTGETPIVKDTDGQGAAARVIQVKLDEKLFTRKEGLELATKLKENYGFAGEILINYFIKDGFDEIRQLFEDYADLLETYQDIQDKQINAGAIVLAAYETLNKVVFNNSLKELKAKDVKKYLSTKRDSAPDLSAFSDTLGWIASNHTKFTDKDSNEVYGKANIDYIYVLKRSLSDFLKSEGYDPNATYSAWADRGFIETFESGSGDDKVVRTDKVVRIGNFNARALIIKRDAVDEAAEMDEQHDKDMEVNHDENGLPFFFK